MESIMKRKNTGIVLEPDVMEFLEKLKHETDRPRTWLINSIIRQYAKTTQGHHKGPLQSPVEAALTT
jgi:predicted transcriptional regulator